MEKAFTKAQEQGTGVGLHNRGFTTFPRKLLYGVKKLFILMFF